MDVSAIMLVAHRLDEAAETVQARAVQIRFGAATTRWRSTAADTYVRKADDLAAQLTGCAAALTELSELVRLRAARLAHQP